MPRLQATIELAPRQLDRLIQRRLSNITAPTTRPDIPAHLRETIPRLGSDTPPQIDPPRAPYRPPPLTTLMVGEIITTQKNIYTIEKDLAETGMSVIYLARDLQNQEVVIKTAKGEKNAQALEAEGRILARDIKDRLGRPVFPKLLDATNIASEQEYAVVMELIAGTTLSKHVRELEETVEMTRLENGAEVEAIELGALLRREQHVPLHQAIDIIMQVLYGLEALHPKGIVHRDIKPGNIMLEPTRTRLLDAGIACPMGYTPEENKTAGTPMYMAPEQVKGEPVDGRSDVYATGLVFHELVLGENPKARKTIREALLSHITQEVQVDDKVGFKKRLSPPEGTLQTQIDAAYVLFQEIIHSMAARDMQKRPEATAAITELTKLKTLVAEIEGRLSA
ncbi:MAG: serine/threonine protein kinase [Candidatus Saganbacteria bacterium]|nr:serine/threonine protein kinase [Candidatus Saganbacteria bacterium]